MIKRGCDAPDDGVADRIAQLRCGELRWVAEAVRRAVFWIGRTAPSMIRSTDRGYKRFFCERRLCEPGALRLAGGRVEVHEQSAHLLGKLFLEFGVAYRIRLPGVTPQVVDRIEVGGIVVAP